MKKYENRFKHIRVPRDDSIPIWDAVEEELETLGDQGWRVTQVTVKDMGLAALLVMSREKCDEGKS